jgi:hypothetical protein
MRIVGFAVIVTLAFLSAPAAAANFNGTMGTDDAGTFVWNVNGANNPTLTLARGSSYTFAVNAPGHPFDIKTAAVTGTADQLDAGVSQQGVTSGTVTFDVPTNATPPLFYQCEIHPTMSGSLLLASPAAPWAPSSAPWLAGLLGVTLCAGGFLALRARRA